VLAVVRCLMLGSGHGHRERVSGAGASRRAGGTGGKDASQGRTDWNAFSRREGDATSSQRVPSQYPARGGISRAPARTDSDLQRLARAIECGH
jgi:hypothetical protein